MVGAVTGFLLTTFVALAWPAQEGAAPKSPPQIAATFYPWYDHPKSGFVAEDGRELLRDHFVAPERVHAADPEWYAGELAEAADAGLDLLLFATVAPPDAARPWTGPLAQALAATRGRLARPVRAALLLEPWLLAQAHAKAGGRGKLDLADAAEQDLLLDAIPDFFRAIAPEDWGRVDGAPLVLVGASGGLLHVPDDLFEQMARRAQAALGVAPHLVVDRTWQREGWPQWREGSPVLGVQEGPVASLAPGFDERQLDHPREVLRPREGGRVYAAAWQELLAQPPPRAPRLVVVESWNQMYDGSAIAPTLEHGRRYVELTRRYADLLRRGERPNEAAMAPRFDTLVGMAEYAEDRRFSTQDDVAYRPGDDEGGIDLASDCDAALAFVATATGAALVASARGGQDEACLRFDVTPVFPAAAAERFAATLRFKAAQGATVSLLGRQLAATPGDRTDAEWRLLGSAKAQGNGIDALTIELSAPELRSEPAPKRRASLELHFRGGPIELHEVALRRLDHRLNDGGEPAPFHRVVLRWRDLEPSAGAVDDAAIDAALGSFCDCKRDEKGQTPARCCGLVVLADAPAWAVPVGAHAQAVADFVRHVVAAMAKSSALRLLELFPAANRPGDFGRASDPQGYVRVLRAVAAATHAVAPHVALTLGAIRGPDVTWLRTIELLKQPFVYDAATFELDDESGIPGDATCEREFERMVAQWRAGGDGEKPFLLERRGWTTGPGPLAAGDRARLLSELVRAAWKRRERPPEPIDVFDQEALPIVFGMPAARIVGQFEAAGLAAAARPEPQLLEALAAKSVHTLVLGQGELFPEQLAERLAAFVDGGGLLVCFGGAPFRRAARRGDAGGFTLFDTSKVGMDLRDSLRIEIAEQGAALRRAAVPASVAELLPFRELELATAATFVRRAGRPRDPNGFHRYEALLAAGPDGRPGGDLAALLVYSGTRAGALLLIGLDGGGRRLSDAEVADAERSLRALARKVGAAALFLLPSGEGR